MSLRNWVKNLLLKRGMVISRPPGQFNLPEVKIAAARDRGLKVACAIDGGAADGNWAAAFRAIYPQARILCVEPRQDTQAHLAQVARQLGNVDIAPVLIGDVEGEIDFFENGDQSSMLKDVDGRLTQSRRARIATIDNLVRERGLPGPDFIKLDLQGAELKALAGAAQSLKVCQAIEIEVSFIRFYEGMPLIADTMDFMKAHDFVLYDVLGLWHRPLDGAMVQGDFLFLKRGHALLADHKYYA